tara:strand:- start:2843 stop:3358 length:516 start_codon:yes stop_codon:yes gene_type:complete
MARAILTGVDEIEKTLRKLSDKTGDRVARSALGAGLGEVAKRIKKAAPVGKTKSLQKSIGKRYEKTKRIKYFQAKAGVNVGKQKKTAEGFEKKINAPHAHLVALGTKQRTRKRIGGKFSYIRKPSSKQLSTGTMPSNPFVRTAYNASKNAVMSRMIRKAEQRLNIELAKSK